MTNAVIEAVEFRREQYGWTKARMAREMDMWPAHYTDFLKGRRQLSLSAVRRAYQLGVPAKVLLDDPDFKRVSP